MEPPDFWKDGEIRGARFGVCGFLFTSRLEGIFGRLAEGALSFSSRRGRFSLLPGVSDCFVGRSDVGTVFFANSLEPVGSLLLLECSGRSPLLARALPASLRSTSNDWLCFGFT